MGILERLLVRRPGTSVAQARLVRVFHDYQSTHPGQKPLGVLPHQTDPEIGRVIRIHSGKLIGDEIARGARSGPGCVVGAIVGILDFLRNR